MGASLNSFRAPESLMESWGSGVRAERAESQWGEGVGEETERGCLARWSGVFVSSVFFSASWPFGLLFLFLSPPRTPSLPLYLMIFVFEAMETQKNSK